MRQTLQSLNLGTHHSGIPAFRFSFQYSSTPLFIPLFQHSNIPVSQHLFQYPSIYSNIPVFQSCVSTPAAFFPIPPLPWHPRGRNRPRAIVLFRATPLLVTACIPTGKIPRKVFLQFLPNQIRLEAKTFPELLFFFYASRRRRESSYRISPGVEKMSGSVRHLIVYLKTSAGENSLKSFSRPR